MDVIESNNSKVAILADCQLYKRLYGLSDTQQDWYNAFAQAINYINQANDIGVTFLLGDILDAECIGADAAFAFISNVQKCKTPIVAILGNHDCPSGDNAISWLHCAQLVKRDFYILDEKEILLNLNHKHICIYGLSYRKPRILQEKLNSIQLHTKADEYWLCLHQALQELSFGGGADLSCKDVPAVFNKCFLGDFHDQLFYKDTQGRQFMYPGAIETVSFNQKSIPGFSIWDTKTDCQTHISTQQREYLTFEWAKLKEPIKDIFFRVEASIQSTTRKPIVKLYIPSANMEEARSIQSKLEGMCLKVFMQEAADAVVDQKIKYDLPVQADRKELTQLAIKILETQEDPIAHDAAIVLENAECLTALQNKLYPKAILIKN